MSARPRGAVSPPRASRPPARGQRATSRGHRAAGARSSWCRWPCAFSRHRGRPHGRSNRPDVHRRRRAIGAKRRPARSSASRSTVRTCRHSCKPAGSRRRRRIQDSRYQNPPTAKWRPRSAPTRRVTVAVRDPGRPAHLHRSRADRRQRADEDHARSKASCSSRAAIPLSRPRSPKASAGWRPSACSAAFASAEAAPRRRNRPRRADFGRGGAGDDHRYGVGAQGAGSLKPRPMEPSPSGRHRTARHLRSRARRNSVREEPIAEPLHQRQPQRRSRASPNIASVGTVPRATAVRFGRRTLSVNGTV